MHIFESKIGGVHLVFVNCNALSVGQLLHLLRVLQLHLAS